MPDSSAVSLAPRFHALFAGLEYAHGSYQHINWEQARSDGKYLGEPHTFRTPVTDALWHQHLAGKYGLGILMVHDDSTCLFGAIDVDVYADLDIGRVAATVGSLGFPLVVCRSKSGGAHLYIFCSAPVAAAKMQAKLRDLAAQLGYGGAEIFPKQTKRGTADNDLGSWINCPYFDAANTKRYAVRPDGLPMTAEEFLTAAESAKVGPGYFEEQAKTAKGKGKPAKKDKARFVLPDTIVLGQQDNTLTAFAGTMRRAGANEGEILAGLRKVNARCDPPVLDPDLERIAKSVARYEPGSSTDGFVLDDTGVYHESKDKDGNVSRVFVCGSLTLDAYARTTASDIWSLLLSFKNRDGETHEVMVGAGSLETPGNKWLVDLLDAGLDAADNVLLKRYLKTRRVDKRMRLVDRIGWTSDHRVFMLPSGPVPRLSGEEWVYKGHDRVLFGTKGTLDEWRANVSKYCVGNCLLTFAVSSAFLAPLLPLLGATEGRAFHYFHDSSSGKTTALQVAGSVCGGGGKLGFLQTWNSTLNAMEGVAAAHNHCALLLDELGEMDSRKAGQLAYVIVGGQGKARMNRSAELRESLSWLNVVFSTGEVSLERHMKAADNDARLMGGQEVRIISIPADAECGHGVFENLHGLKAAAFADMLKQASNEYYGTALRAWLEALAARPDEFITRARKAADDFKAKYVHAVGPQVGRVAESFALVAAAGTLATEEGITGWPQGAAAESAAKCFASWLKERGTEGSSDEASIIKQVRRFYQLHGDSRFKTLGENPRIVINQAGYVVGNEFWTSDQVFESEVCKGFEPRQVARALKSKGYLIADKDRFTSKRTAPGIARARFYVVCRDSILGDEQQLPLAA